MEDDTDPIVRLTIDCKASIKKKFEHLFVEMKKPYGNEKYGDLLEELIKFYNKNSDMRPKFGFNV